MNNTAPRTPLALILANLLVPRYVDELSTCRPAHRVFAEYQTSYQRAMIAAMQKALPAALGTFASQFGEMPAMTAQHIRSFLSVRGRSESITPPIIEGIEDLQQEFELLTATAVSALVIAIGQKREEMEDLKDGIDEAQTGNSVVIQQLRERVELLAESLRQSDARQIATYQDLQDSRKNNTELRQLLESTDASLKNANAELARSTADATNLAHNSLQAAVGAILKEFGVVVSSNAVLDVVRELCERQRDAESRVTALEKSLNIANKELADERDITGINATELAEETIRHRSAPRQVLAGADHVLKRHAANVRAGSVRGIPPSITTAGEIDWPTPDATLDGDDIVGHAIREATKRNAKRAAVRELPPTAALFDKIVWGIILVAGISGACWAGWKYGIVW